MKKTLPLAALLLASATVASATVASAQSVTIGGGTITGSPDSVTFELGIQPNSIVRGGGTTRTSVGGSGDFHTEHSLSSNLRPTSMGCATGGFNCGGGWASVILNTAAGGRGSLELTYTGGLANASGFDLFVFENGDATNGSELFYTSVYSGGVWSDMRYTTAQAYKTSPGSTGFLNFIDFSIFGLGAGASIDAVRFTGGLAGDMGTYDAGTNSWIVNSAFTGANAFTDYQGNAFVAGDFDPDILLVGVMSGRYAAVSEPAALSLLMIGVGAMALRCKRVTA